MLTVIRVHRRRCQSRGTGGPRSPATQDRYQERIPDRGGPPRGPLTTGYAMGRRTLCGHGLAIWTTISAEDIYGTGGCLGVGHPIDGDKVVLHYLDDFLLVGEPASEQCKDNLQKLLAVFTALHIPVAREKLEGPTTRLSFLGIELDTHLRVLRLPQEKIEELRALLAQWRTKKWCCHV